MVAGDLGELVSQFSSRLELLTGIPQCHFYLTHQGMVMWYEFSLGRLGCDPDALICMRAGLRVMVNLLWCLALGTVTYAIWEGGGRRVTRVSVHNVLLLSSPRTDVRRHLALALLRHRLRLVVPPCVSSAGGSGTQAVLKTLLGLGLSEDLLVQVAKSPKPPSTKKVSSRERQMTQLKEPKNRLSLFGNILSSFS